MPRYLDYVSVGAAVVVLALGVATLAIQSTSIQALEDNIYDSDFDNEPRVSCWPHLQGTCDKVLWLVPQTYLTGVPLSILAAGGICVAAGILSLAFTFFNLRASSTPKVRNFSLASCAVSCASALVSFSVFVAAFVEESRSSTWRYSGPQSVFGQYTPESWACQMQHQFPSWDNTFSFWAPACKNATTARWLTLPLAGFSIILAALSMLGHRQHVSTYRVANQGEDSELKAYRQSVASI
ncbi:Hypothetical protein R9X50_00463100 [Acrodontium crateriforme]|uniref:Transmembrane protein n=1 Tax=Acrodontium crateriforme TaxID=150365 RepID=A0AAQ3M7Z3_9PEZI|nr:Hypothetical protein R9X50_00463100 [Acrodontium crateriforme]